MNMPEKKIIPVPVSSEDLLNLAGHLQEQNEVEGHPNLSLLTGFAVQTLSPATGQAIGEHMRGCPRCAIVTEEFLILATVVGADRDAIHATLGLRVPLVEALRSGRRALN